MKWSLWARVTVGLCPAERGMVGPEGGAGRREGMQEDSSPLAPLLEDDSQQVAEAGRSEQAFLHTGAL